MYRIQISSFKVATEVERGPAVPMSQMSLAERLTLSLERGWRSLETWRKGRSLLRLALKARRSKIVAELKVIGRKRRRRRRSRVGILLTQRRTLNSMWATTLMFCQYLCKRVTFCTVQGPKRLVQSMNLSCPYLLDIWEIFHSQT